MHVYIWKGNGELGEMESTPYVCIFIANKRFMITVISNLIYCHITVANGSRSMSPPLLSSPLLSPCTQLHSSLLLWRVSRSVSNMGRILCSNNYTHSLTKASTPCDGGMNACIYIVYIYIVYICSIYIYIYNV